MFAIIKTVILIKKHIIKSTLTLKKVLFIGLLSLIFNSNSYSQNLSGPSGSSWVNIHTTEPFDDSFGSDSKYHDSQDIFGNSSNPVFQGLVEGSNVYFRVLLNRKTSNNTGSDKKKDLKFYIGVSLGSGANPPIDFFIHHKRKEKNDNDNHPHEIKFHETKSDDFQTKPDNTSIDHGDESSELKLSSSNTYFNSINIGSDISNSGFYDYYYEFGFPLSELQTWLDDKNITDSFALNTSMKLVFFTLEGGHNLGSGKAQDISNLQSVNSNWSYISKTLNNFSADTSPPTITAIQTTAFSWGSVLNATEDNSDGTVSVTTSGVEDGQTLTITLNGATYTNIVSSNASTVTISAA